MDVTLEKLDDFGCRRCNAVLGTDRHSLRQKDRDEEATRPCARLCRRRACVFSPNDRTAGFSSLLEQGCAYLPALRVAGSEETEGQTVLLEAGYGVLRDGKLAGYLDGESAKGLELLTGQTAEDIIEVDLPSGRAVARITEVSTRCEPIFQGEELAGLRLRCRATAELAEFRAPMDEGELDQLREALEERESLRLQRVMDQLRSWGIDCTALGSQVGRADPARWENLRENWERLFSSVPLEISVQVSVSRTYGDLA